eukprot:scaffold26375_cov23-Tisochrysis_lutea.AAC.1
MAFFFFEAKNCKTSKQRALRSSKHNEKKQAITFKQMPVATAARMLYTLCLPSKGVMICSLPKGVRTMTCDASRKQCRGKMQLTPMECTKDQNRNFLMQRCKAPVERA